MNEPEWTEDDGRILTSEELLPMLERYFVPPISRVHADWLHQRLFEIVKDPPRRTAESEAYQGMRKYRGTAWQCELSRGIRSPRVKDLAMFIACRTRGFPAPKLHCPQPFWGTWREAEGPAPGSIWHLAPTGSAQVVGAEEKIAVPTRWYVSFNTADRSPELPPRPHDWGVLHLDNGWGSWTEGHGVVAVAPSELVVESPVYRKPYVLRRLERVSDDAGLPEVWQTVP